MMDKLFDWCLARGFPLVTVSLATLYVAGVFASALIGPWKAIAGYCIGWLLAKLVETLIKER